MNIDFHLVMLDDVTRSQELLYLPGFAYADLEEAKKVARFLTEQACCNHSVRTYAIPVSEIQKALNLSKNEVAT